MTTEDAKDEKGNWDAVGGIKPIEIYGPPHFVCLDDVPGFDRGNAAGYAVNTSAISKVWLQLTDTIRQFAPKKVGGETTGTFSAIVWARMDGERINLLEREYVLSGVSWHRDSFEADKQEESAAVAEAVENFHSFLSRFPGLGSLSERAGGTGDW